MRWRPNGRQLSAVPPRGAPDRAAQAGMIEPTMVRRPPTRSSVLAAIVLFAALAGWTALTFWAPGVRALDARFVAPELDPLSPLAQIAAAVALVTWPGMAFVTLLAIAFWAVNHRLRQLSVALVLTAAVACRRGRGAAVRLPAASAGRRAGPDHRRGQKLPRCAHDGGCRPGHRRRSDLRGHPAEPADPGDLARWVGRRGAGARPSTAGSPVRTTSPTSSAAPSSERSWPPVRC